MHTLRTNVAIILMMIVIFDLATFVFLPDKYASRFDGYRHERLSDSAEKRTPNALGRGYLPQNYFVKHSDRGFDIGMNKHANHFVDGMSYPIWSNSIGCFDIEHLQYDRYVYIAGDSTAWGYTPFDEKFGTLLERMTGKQILKCGVNHTGQRHQLDKLIEIVDTIGILPETILVTYSSNDIINDYAHPHTSVVSGWQVDSVTLDDDDQSNTKMRVHRHSHKDLQDKFDAEVRRLSARNKLVGWLDRAKAVIRRFSLTAQLANLVIKKNVSRECGGGLYCLPQDADGKQWYLDNPFAHQNKAALLEFKSFAEKNDVRLIVVLMPLKKAATVPEEYYTQARIFLESNNIEFIDPAFSLVRKGIVWSDLFWTRDSHLNPAGNKVIAHILMEEASPVFQ